MWGLYCLLKKADASSVYKKQLWFTVLLPNRQSDDMPLARHVTSRTFPHLDIYRGLPTSHTWEFLKFQLWCGKSNSCAIVFLNVQNPAKEDWPKDHWELVRDDEERRSKLPLIS